MLTICAWCGEVLKEGFKSKGISHGICGQCSDQVLNPILNNNESEAHNVQNNQK